MTPSCRFFSNNSIRQRMIVGARRTMGNRRWVRRCLLRFAGSSFAPSSALLASGRLRARSLGAAYKGVMALILQDSPLDFMTGHRMDIASYIDEDADIHHIFPQTYCEKNNLIIFRWHVRSYVRSLTVHVLLFLSDHSAPLPV